LLDLSWYGTDIVEEEIKCWGEGWGVGVTQELVLQEEGIERIDTLGILCPHLRILYMPNNLIACLENMNRLKELQYLNLAMNNIVKVCVAYHLLC
jgi:hypothetical protein